MEAGAQEHEEQDNGEIAVGQQGEDLMEAPKDDQQPIGEAPGGTGTVQPRSAPAPGAPVEGAGEAAGEAAAGDGHDAGTGEAASS